MEASFRRYGLRDYLAISVNVFEMKYRNVFSCRAWFGGGWGAKVLRKTICALAQRITVWESGFSFAFSALICFFVLMFFILVCSFTSAA